MKFHVFVALLFSIGTVACGQEKMDFEEYDPPSTLVVPEHPLTRAKYPFIDVHNHQWTMSKGDLDRLVKDMDKMNMVVMVNLSGRGRGSTGTSRQQPKERSRELS